MDGGDRPAAGEKTRFVCREEMGATFEKMWAPKYAKAGAVWSWETGGAPREGSSGGEDRPVEMVWTWVLERA